MTALQERYAMLAHRLPFSAYSAPAISCEFLQRLALGGAYRVQRTSPCSMLRLSMRPESLRACTSLKQRQQMKAKATHLERRLVAVVVESSRRGVTFEDVEDVAVAG